MAVSKSLLVKLRYRTSPSAPSPPPSSATVPTSATSADPLLLPPPPPLESTFHNYHDMSPVLMPASPDVSLDPSSVYDPAVMMHHHQQQQQQPPLLEHEHDHDHDHESLPEDHHHLPPQHHLDDAAYPEQQQQHHLMEPLEITTAFESGAHPGSLAMAPSPMMPLTTAEILSERRRRKSTSALKRSASTPNVRALHTNDAAMTLAEKRRNKLGYHRTSIACSHCRRRKIRCLLAPEDLHGRCANCIRLKKECNFFPVDQQPPIERRPRHASSKMDGGNSSSADSSPAIGPGMMPHDQYHPYHSVPLPQDGFIPAHAPWNNGLVSPMTRAPLDSRGSIDFSQAPPQSHWHSPFAEHTPMSAGHSSPGGEMGQTYWGRHDSPMTPNYSPHMSGPTSSMNSMSEARSSFTSYAPSRTDSAWSAPQRAMSMGIVEDLPAGYHRSLYHPQPLSMDFRRRASEMRPASLMTSSNSSSTNSLSEPYMTPLSAPISSPPQTWAIQSAWNALPSSAVTKPTDFGTWYSEPSLAKVQEEEIAPPFGEQPAILYAGEAQ